MAKGKLVGVCILYIMVAVAVRGSFYVSIIYCLTVAGKHPFLSLHTGKISHCQKSNNDKSCVEQYCNVMGL